MHMVQPWRPPLVESAYREVLRAVADGADGIGRARLTSHWPLLGTAPERLLVIGQAVFGWIPDWETSDLQSQSGFERVLRETQAACYDRVDPMSWIAAHPVRSSPFWRMVRRSVELLWSDSAFDWYSHVAWANLYPVAPNEPKGNPSGPLLEAQTEPAAQLLGSIARELRPRFVLILGGPYWWAFQDQFGLTPLGRDDRPLLAAGVQDGAPWLVGMHPAGAQRRGWSADDYARRVADRWPQLRVRGESRQTLESAE